MVLRFLIEKEFKQIVRDRVMLSLILFFPVVVLLGLPWTVSFEVKDVNVAVVNHSLGKYSMRLISKLEGSTSFDTVFQLGSYQEAYTLVQQNQVDIIVQIPNHFDRDFALGRTPKVQVSASAVDGTQALLANNYLVANIREFVSQVRQECLPGVSLLPLRMVVNNRYNPSSDFKIYMLPAFIVILITLVCGMLPALNIVQEKERGTIQQLNVTPVKKWQLILSKMIPYWVIGLLILVVSVVILYLIYGLAPRGRLSVIFLMSVIFIVAVTGMGIVISNYSNTLQQAMLMVMFFVLIFLLMSGLFTQVNGMPFWGQIIAYLNPLTYYMESLRLLYLKGAYITDLYLNIIILLGFNVLINLWAVVSYKKVG